MVAGRNHYAADSVFPLAAPLIDLSLGFVESGNLTRKNSFVTEMVNERLFDHVGTNWTGRELPSLQWEISKVKTVAERTDVPRCSSGFSTLNCHLLDPSREDLESFGSFLCMHAAPFEHFSVLIKQP